MTSSNAPLYPGPGPQRDRWILSQRPARHRVSAHLPHAFLAEQERTTDGDLASVSTVFLTNRECPWRCLMCDLWRNTLEEKVPAGAIPAQIAHALSRLPPARQIKLYNSGSFFDPQAIPQEDYSTIAEMLQGFERVVVESHPSLIGSRTILFRDLISAQLEVAMGLETVHPEALAALNKRMTLDQFRGAAEFLRDHQIDLRAFVLVQPPFIQQEQALHWVQRSIDFAFDCGATVVSIIPTRAGNGAMEELERAGAFSSPSLKTVEAALDYGISAARGRVFADLWDIDRAQSMPTHDEKAWHVTDCSTCRNARVERLAAINLSQTLLPQPECPACGSAA
jgi:radical SAM enzyme (TIGR01210 family)